MTGTELPRLVRLLARWLPLVIAVAGCFGLPGPAGPPPTEDLQARTADEGAMSGRVLLEDGRPARDVAVTAYLADRSPLVGNNSAGLVSEGLGNFRILTAAGTADSGDQGPGKVATRTDGAGRFALRPPAGRYNVEAVQADLTRKGWRGGIEYTGVARADAGDLRLLPTGSIAGRVRVMASKVDDLSNVHVFIPGSSYTAVTGPDGAYVLSGVPAGEFPLRAYHVHLGDGKLPDQESPSLIAVSSGKETRAPAILLSVQRPTLARATRADTGGETDNAPPGTEVDLHGEAFGAGRGTRFEVRFTAATAVTADRRSESLIRVKVPVGAQTGEVVVMVGGLLSDGLRFRVMRTFALRPDPRAVAVGDEVDLGREVIATDTRDEPIQEVLDGGVSKRWRPNLAWRVDSERGYVTDRGVFRALAIGSVRVTVSAGDLPPVTIPVTVIDRGRPPSPDPARTTNPTPAATATPVPTGGATPLPAPTAAPTSSAEPTAPKPTSGPTSRPPPSPIGVASPSPPLVPVPFAVGVSVRAESTTSIYVPGPDPAAQINPTTVLLTATVRMSDGSTGSAVAWESSSSAVAPVGPSGLVRAMSRGRATISAISPDGRASGSVIVTVLAGGNFTVIVE